MNWMPSKQAEALMARFNALDIANEPGTLSRIEAVVWLIGWLQDRPTVTESEYRAELTRVQREPIAWPPIVFGP